VATMEQSLKALEGILGDLASNPAAAGLDRSLSCRLTDLDEVVLGRLGSGAVRDLHVVPHGPALPKADIRLTMSSDDLIALTDGQLNFGSAWATGRVKLEAGLRDLLRLRKIL
jgi:SCP-2 sterol transfer family